MNNTVQISYLINRRYADYRQGTGVQLALIARQLSPSALHICWDDGHPIKETYRPVCNLNTSLLRWWLFKRGKGLVTRIEHALGVTWHSKEILARRTIRLKKKWSGASAPRVCTYAYVIVAHEDEARIARTVLGSLKADYVLNIVDFHHRADSALESYPEFAALLKEARQVFALTPTIRDELQSLSGRTDIQLLGIGRPYPARAAEAPRSGQCLQIVMVGGLGYRRGMEQLAHYCRGLDTRRIPYSLNYVGPREFLTHFPPGLEVNYRGALSDQARDAVLSQAHLAYLPYPDSDPVTDYLAHYSFPSRLADYFWHGIPVIGPVYPTSATARMLKDLLGNGVWFSLTSEDLVNATARISQNPASWCEASQRVIRFAKDHFDLTTIAKAISDAFSDAKCSGQS